MVMLIMAMMVVMVAVVVTNIQTLNLYIVTGAFERTTLSKERERDIIFLDGDKGGGDDDGGSGGGDSHLDPASIIDAF